MRKLIVLSIATCLTGCATLPDNVDQQTNNDYKQYQKKETTNLLTGLLAIAAIAYVANEVADNNRNKQCTNDKILYRGVGGMYGNLYVCPNKLP